jgi:hypothetical protein
MILLTMLFKTFISILFIILTIYYLLKLGIKKYLLSKYIEKNN